MLLPQWWTPCSLGGCSPLCSAEDHPELAASEPPGAHSVKKRKKKKKHDIILGGCGMFLCQFGKDSSEWLSWIQAFLSLKEAHLWSWYSQLCFYWTKLSIFLVFMGWDNIIRILRRAAWRHQHRIKKVRTCRMAQCPCSEAFFIAVSAIISCPCPRDTLYKVPWSMENPSFKPERKDMLSTYYHARGEIGGQKLYQPYPASLHHWVDPHQVRG